MRALILTTIDVALITLIVWATLRTANHFAAARPMVVSQTDTGTVAIPRYNNLSQVYF